MGRIGSGQPDPTHPPTPTHNHIFLCGGLGEWLYRTVGGISPVAEGYRQARVFPDIVEGRGPGSANTSVITPRGTIAVSWVRLGSGSATVSVSVPAAVETVRVSFRSPADGNGKPAATASLKVGTASVWTAAGGFVKGASVGVGTVTWTQASGGILTADIAPGSYAFTFTA